MARSHDETLADLTRMEESLSRMTEVMYAQTYYQKLYDAAFCRVAADLGPRLNVLKLLLPNEPQALIDGVRQFMNGMDWEHDVPETLPPDVDPW